MEKYKTKIILSNILDSSSILYEYTLAKKKVIEERLLYLLSKKEWKVEYVKYKKETMKELEILNRVNSMALEQILYINRVKALIDNNKIKENNINENWRYRYIIK